MLICVKIQWIGLRLSIANPSCLVLQIITFFFIIYGYLFGYVYKKSKTKTP